MVFCVRKRKKGLGLSPQKPQVIPAATQTRVPTASHCAESRCSSHGLPRYFRLWASVKPRLRAACRRYRGFRRASLLRAHARASNSAVPSTKPHLRLDDNGTRRPPVENAQFRAVFKGDGCAVGGAGWKVAGSKRGGCGRLRYVYVCRGVTRQKLKNWRGSVRMHACWCCAQQ